jgi:uncharacterized protein (TIGR00251 family)
MTGPIRPAGTGIELLVHVQPGAKRTEVAGPFGDAIRIRVAAPPVDGAANDALVAFLAETLEVSKRAIRIVTGQTGRRKRVAVDGVAPPEVAERLGLESS